MIDDSFLKKWVSIPIIQMIGPLSETVLPSARFASPLTAVPIFRHFRFVPSVGDIRERTTFRRIAVSLMNLFMNLPTQCARATNLASGKFAQAWDVRATWKSRLYMPTGQCNCRRGRRYRKIRAITVATRPTGNGRSSWMRSLCGISRRQGAFRPKSHICTMLR